MQHMRKWLELPRDMKVREWIFLSLPFLLFLSYLPHIYLGMNSGANLDISLLHVGLGIFSLLSLPVIWRRRTELLKKRAVQALLAFGSFASLSLLWTPNTTRGFLAIALIGLIISSFLGFFTLERLSKLLPVFVKLLILSAVIAALSAWYQVVGEALGLSASFTFLPENYRSGVFGFARPTGFAQEPQFLGSLLLAPILYLTYRFLKHKTTQPEISALFFLFVTLIATVSRGAIVAALLGMGLLCLMQIKNIQRVVGTGLAILVATAVSLTLLGAMAAIKSDSEVSFYGAITKTVNHLSLGMIELPQKTELKSSGYIETGMNKQLQDTGYVKASTEERLTMNDMALRTITESPQTFFFGVGIGGTGFAYHDRYGCPESCINFVEYLDIWVELGLVGLLLFVGLVGSLVLKSSVKPLIVVYLFQWLFFAGYPNSLPVFVILGLLGVLAMRSINIKQILERL